ncbi:MAG: NosD domain-containing protein [Promethearchaeota archaeon]
MGEQTGTRLNRRSAACKFPSESMRKKQLLRPRRTFMAVSLTLILTTTGLVYYLMQPSGMLLDPWVKGNHVIRTPHAAIAIDGDANFSDTALLEGWPGDGSPENPYIIDSLEIDLGGEFGDCISIKNTRVCFIISNCNLTGGYYDYMDWWWSPGAGINLWNVAGGELVKNTCNGNNAGIAFQSSDSNTLANNTCNSNTKIGINLWLSGDNTLLDNTCNSNDIGIFIHNSDSNAVANNICNNNGIGINLEDSYSNTVANNILLGNTEHDICLSYSAFRTLDPMVLLLTGLVTGIIMLGAGWKMVKLWRVESRGE